MEQTLYNKEGKEAGMVTLDESVFNRAINEATLSEAVRSMQKNERPSLAQVKDRGDVRGGGRKPWRQKGTGRARHGSIRSPIWRGGGVTHGPTNVKVTQKKINKKVALSTLSMALSAKRADNQIAVIEELSQSKTGEMRSLLHDMFGAGELGRSILIVLESRDENVERSVRNLPFVDIAYARTLSLLDVLSHRRLVITKSALQHLTERLS